MAFWKSAALLGVATLLAGCMNLPYYLQSVRGQLDIWSRQNDIEAVIEQPQTPEPLREKLRAVLAIREFASSELGLPRNASYRSYANLERPYVIWNVFAAPEFSIEPHQWCFVFAGCVNYRGYFQKTDAEDTATGLSSEGFDVFVGGVPAYSMLGYFPDPVLNTFVNYPTPYLARLVFHELAHQVVYVRDDSIFNESFAVAVEQEGMRRWLDRYGTDQDRATSTLIAQRRVQFVNLIETYRGRLDALYRSGLPAAEMRTRKAASFAQLDDDYRKLKETWGGFAGLDGWFSEKPNNALLASVSIYTQKVPAFEAILAREHGDLGRFYAAVKALASLRKPERTAALERVMPRTAEAAATAH
ncbi:MAG TPA: aminopeptidase [Burkholderiales bacterium]|jgi:predicted aminopeptidase|nr:aminopeptidase [Burkholderiales bacterium]